MSIVEVNVEHARQYIFAGGGTGGHIYPSLAVADEIKRLDPKAHILFFSSRREIDARILSRTPYEFLPLPAQGFSARPDRLIRFLGTQYQSLEFVRHILRPVRGYSVVISTGGFVSVPVVLSARKYNIPVFMLNTDAVPGKANRFLARYAREIFVQFRSTIGAFTGMDAIVTLSGCPVRREFLNPEPLRAVKDLELENEKKILLITGASSGSASINRGVCASLGCLSALADRWQVVHLTGLHHRDEVQAAYANTPLTHRVIDYYDNMPDLMAAAHLVVGRGGAVSVAEYTAAARPVIILPYPYHKDKHQYMNARQLVTSGAAILVEDHPDNPKQTAESLCETLLHLMEDETLLGEMAESAAGLAMPNAASLIAEHAMRA